MSQDEVDVIIAAWRRERPDLDTAPLEVLSRITRLSHRLGRLRQRVFADHGLEAWEFDVLAALRRAGTPYELSPGQLSSETLVTSGTMTNRLDRLTTRGLVRRSPAVHDRRGVTVQLSDAGRTLVDRTFSALVAAEHDLLGAAQGWDDGTLAAQLRALLAATS